MVEKKVVQDDSGNAFSPNLPDYKVKREKKVLKVLPTKKASRNYAKLLKESVEDLDLIGSVFKDCFEWLNSPYSKQNVSIRELREELNRLLKRRNKLAMVFNEDFEGKRVRITIEVLE